MAVNAKVDVEIEMPVVRDLKDFDRNSGNQLERIIFNNRLFLLVLCSVLTVFFGFHATKLQVNGSFEKMIPQAHPYIKNFLENKDSLRAMGNSVRIVVENTQGTIFDKDYLLILQKITDKLMLTPGVDRSWTRGLWTPSLAWIEVTEKGFVGGPVMPDAWDGSTQSNELLKTNISRAGIVGSYVSLDMRSSMIMVPLMDHNQETNQPLDYAEFSAVLEKEIRSLETDKVKVHIVGFAKIVGDLIEGLEQVVKFFAISAVIAGLLVYSYTRCVRSTLLLVASALIGVTWLLGVLRLAGFTLDPYSILVPFLIFAIGLSHGAQKMNGIMQDVGRGTDKYVAARYTFRRLFMAGLTALLTNVVGFSVLMVIDIPAIRDMAVATSIGVGILIFTKLVFVPVALSYVGVSEAAARRSVRHEQAMEDRFATNFWQFLALFTQRRNALLAIGFAFSVAAVGFVISLNLKIGDLDVGAPELRTDSRYNRDVAFVTQNFGLSSDQFVVMLKTPAGDCQKYATLIEADRLSESLRQLNGVLAVVSSADGIKMFLSSMNEGNPKWTSLSRNPSSLYVAWEQVMEKRSELGNRQCSMTPVIAYLSDHKADTLTRVTAAVETFAREHDTENRKFLLAAGSAGIEAATNIVVKDANTKMLVLLYAAVALLCFITFRNWRAVLVALIPLFITSILCEALMVILGIGVKVATLPVIALGVGVGVDYALYLLSVQLARQRMGDSLADAYTHALQFTGKVVGLVGVTLAAGVITWAWSPIKFQADMGILLTFMFLWNMIGALFLIPALSHFLLRDKGEVISVDQSVPS